MDDITLEAWRAIPDWVGLYEASSAGRIMSLPRPGGNNRMYGGGILTPKMSKAGGGAFYLAVALSRDGRQVTVRVHQLVAAAFLGPCPPGQQVRHGPGGALDNRVSNLCYGTPLENAADTIRDGTRRYGSERHNAKLTEAAVAEIRRRYANGGETYRTLGHEYGVDWSAIRFIVKRKRWTHVA